MNMYIYIYIYVYIHIYEDVETKSTINTNQFPRVSLRLSHDGDRPRGFDQCQADRHEDMNLVAVSCLYLKSLALCSLVLT